MNYRHGFHAGNFADVFKHALLDARPRLSDAQGRAAALHRHPRWRRALRSRRRGGAALAGMARRHRAAVKAKPPPPVAELLAPYLEALGPFDPQGRTESYPGSPAIAQSAAARGRQNRAVRSAPRGARAADGRAWAATRGCDLDDRRLCQPQRLCCRRTSGAGSC